MVINGIQAVLAFVLAMIAGLWQQQTIVPTIAVLRNGIPHWRYADGTVLPIMAGGDGTAAAPVLTDPNPLKQKRKGFIDEARAIAAKAEEENRDLTEEEEQDFTEAREEAEKLTRRIERIELVNGGMRGGDDPSTPAAPPVPGDDPLGDEERDLLVLDGDEARQYSLLRAIRAAADRNWDDAPIERKATDRVAEMMDLDVDGARQVLIPYDYLRRPVRTSVRGLSARERRDLLADSGEGPETIQTDVLITQFIDLLRNRLVSRQAGMTVLTGLRGDLALPRQTAAGAAGWVAEGSAVAEVTATLDQVAFSPSTVGFFTDYSRKLLLQSSLDVEAFVRADLAAGLAVELDRTVFHGSGSGAEPQGLRGMTGVNNIEIGANGGAPTWAHIVDMETQVAIDNADLGRLAYITNAQVRGKLKVTSKAGTEAIFVWTDAPQPLNGYNAFATQQILANLTKGAGVNLSAIFFGNWQDAILAMWGTVSLLVDPYTAGTSFLIRIIAGQEADFNVRHPDAFAVIDDADTV